MKLTKHDIGAEIISILTRGMYPDPRDAVREYIQNAIDAKSKNVDVKVRQRSVVVEDDGDGMSHETLRKAVRLGVSDKVPGKHVGFMGIGIYHAFHLCDSLTIYTRQAMSLPSMLQMDFLGMRNLLADEKKQRLEDHIDGDRLTDLQTLLEDHILFSDKDELVSDEFPVVKGTRVELEGLDPVLDEPLNDFDQLSNYLRDVVPLKFDKENFLWAQQIEDHIEEVCEGNGATFDIINLKLESQGRDEQLYRPYKNEHFDDNLPREPRYKEMKQGSKFLGVAWGCLNSARRRISNKDLRGFLR